MNSSNFYDEEMSAISLDMSAVSGINIPMKRKQRQNAFIGGLKNLTNKVLSSTGSVSGSVGGDETRFNLSYRRNSNLKGEKDEVSTADNSTASSPIQHIIENPHFIESEANKNEEYGATVPDDDDCSKISFMTDMTGMTDLDVEFPKLRRRKAKKKSPVGMTIQDRALAMFKQPSKTDVTTNNEKENEEVKKKGVNGTIEELLMKAKLELAVTQEKLDHANSRMARVTKERDWLRKQYSSLQYKYMSQKTRIEETEDDY